LTIDIDGPEGPDYDRAYWWGPLERVAELVAEDPEFVDLDLDDFMVMCGYTQGGEHMIEYKHIHTRRCITLSDDGATVYRYVPPIDELDDEDVGHYRVTRSLRAALRSLELPLGAAMNRNLAKWAATREPEANDGGL